MLLLPLATMMFIQVAFCAALCMHMLACMSWLCLPVTHRLLRSTRSGPGRECFSRLLDSLMNPPSAICATDFCLQGRE